MTKPTETAAATSSPTPKAGALGQTEFVILMAALMSLAALATDSMLPALLNIGEDLHVAHANDVQLVISLIFVGIAVGQLLFGPMADALGRKSSMLIGGGIFLTGSLLTIFADSFYWLLAGRVIQGVGLGAPRTITVAIIRDQYVGRQMAKIMSNIMSVFMLVPMVAPMIGQLVILWGGNWRAIFMLIFLLGAVVNIWFFLRQPETLMPENRVGFAFKKFFQAIFNVCCEPVVMFYAIATGLLFGALVCYLSASAHIFQHQYDTGPWFAVIFAIVALALGIASHLNSRWVVQLGMQKISYAAMFVIIVASALFMGYILFIDPKPSLYLVVAYLVLVMFAQGGLFGNINALAMEPLNTGAGIGAMVIGVVSTLVSVPLGVVAARQIVDTVLPLPVAFFVFCSLTLLIMLLVEFKIKNPPG